jgi:hypothetical protein
MRKAAKNVPIIRRMIKIEENEIKSARRMQKGARKSHLMIAGGKLNLGRDSTASSDDSLPRCLSS